MRLILAGLLVIPAASARAEDGSPRLTAASEACAPLEGVGCWYAPPGAGAAPPLLIYLRGHHPTLRARVPPGRALESARQAFEFYGLGETARKAGAALLVTYRSGLAVTEADVARLSAASGLFFTRRLVAAHSGGYVGLAGTLAGGLDFERLVLLDCFYSGSPALAQQVQARLPRGLCAGFHTPDTAANFNGVFKPNAPGCAVERLGPGDHNAGVNRCLGSYLAGESCR